MNDSANRFWKFQGPGILTGENSRFARLDDEVKTEADYYQKLDQK